jgi:glucose/arabinose dehydrogenase
VIARRIAGAAAVLLLASSSGAQTVVDPGLTVEALLPDGSLDQPTTLAFLADDDLLVLEKATGRVRRVLGGVLLPAPVLTIPVNSSSERGLLGIAINGASPRSVFLYVTEAATLDGPPIANRVYRYTWNATTGQLVSPALILDLPVTSGPNHNGGVLALGPPGQFPGVGDGAALYTVIGDLNRNGRLENNATGAAPDDTAVIFRVLQSGAAAPGNPFAPYCSVTTSQVCASDAGCPAGQTCRTQVARYFAYGVRNSFGLTLDRATGRLWDTENGPGSYDEVNLVLPGTNSGWTDLMGPDEDDPQGVGDLFHMPGAGGTYSDPSSPGSIRTHRRRSSSRRAARSGPPTTRSRSSPTATSASSTRCR